MFEWNRYLEYATLLSLCIIQNILKRFDKIIFKTVLYLEVNINDNIQDNYTQKVEHSCKCIFINTLMIPEYWIKISVVIEQELARKWNKLCLKYTWYIWWLIKK